MSNLKLQLNKLTIANLSTEEMLNTAGGGEPYNSSVKRCCDSHCDHNSSDKKCCYCDAAVAEHQPTFGS